MFTGQATTTFTIRTEALVNALVAANKPHHDGLPGIVRTESLKVAHNPAFV
jgi:hypothetical protein